MMNDTKLVPVDPPLSLLPYLTEYSSVEHMSERDRGVILERLRTRLAAILAAIDGVRVDAPAAALYKAANELMAVLGYHGTINARDDRVQAVMDALHAIDAAGVALPPAVPALDAMFEASIKARDATAGVRASQALSECPQCGGSLRTWKCLCTPMWPGYITSDQP